MNNEPVAWMSTTGNNFVSKKAPSYVKRGIDDWIPLYTHPAKTLTDEEIMELWHPLDLHDEAWVDDAVLRDFAKAILKKASEK